MASRDVVLTSRIPEIIARSEAQAALIVDKTTHDIEDGAKRHLVENQSVDTSALLNSGEAIAEGFSGEVSFGTDHSHFVEYGTGERGAGSEFLGKPDYITYSADWAGMAARPYLTPAVEEAREPFELALGSVYGG